MNKKLRTIKKIITEEYNNYPILKYLKILQPQWTKIFAIKMIRTKNVLINNKKTTFNYKLKTGDTIKIYGSLKIQNKNLNLKKLKPLKVIFENENLIIVNKETSISVQSDKKHPLNNMNNRLLNHLNYDNSSISWKPSFVHRLDYNTTGLLIGAKTFKAFNELTEAMKSQQIEKYYKALVNGITSFKKITIKKHLIKTNKKVLITKQSSPKSKKAITEVTLLKHDFKKNNSLLELKLITGRTHQIRAHLQSINHPIKGDQKYGIEKDKKTYPYPALCAYKLKFSDSLTGETIQELRGKEFLIKKIWFEF